MNEYRYCGAAWNEECGAIFLMQLKDEATDEINFRMVM
jgi:hypothetical protein